jgi:hypothetical protein
MFCGRKDAGRLAILKVYLAAMRTRGRMKTTYPIAFGWNALWTEKRASCVPIDHCAKKKPSKTRPF